MKKTKRIPPLIGAAFALTSMSLLTLATQHLKNGRSSPNEIQPVSFTFDQVVNENNWFNQSTLVTVQLANGSPSVSYAIVPDGTTPSANDYTTVTANTLGYQSQYRYRYVTREIQYHLTSPGKEWSQTGNQKKETYWKPDKTETGITPGELSFQVDRYFAIESDGRYTKLTNLHTDKPSTDIPYDTIYRYEADGFYHTAPAYYSTGQAVPMVWQGKYTKTTGPSNLYTDNYLKVQWNTNPNRTLYKYDKIWAPLSITEYQPLLLGMGQTAHVESSPYRVDEWWSNFEALANKNKNTQLVGVDFKRISYRRGTRNTYEWKKDTDSGYLYTLNLSESQNKPTGTVQHEQTTVIKQFQVKLPSNGKYRLYIKQNDGLGNTQTTSSDSLNLDKQIPTFTATVSPKGEVSFTAKDTLSGIASIKLPNGNLMIPSTLGSLSLSGSLVLTKEGTYAFEVTDLAGNKKSYTVTYAKDYEAPQGTHTLSTTDWTNQSVTITVRATDSSGIESIQLPNNQLVASDQVTYTVSENGTYPFLITDNSGNTLTYSVNVTNIDKENPQISISPTTTDWTNQKVTLSFSAKDQPSGIQSMSYQINGGNWTNISNNGQVSQTNEGTYRYRAKAVDQAGNITTTPETVIRLDLTKPTATHRLSTTSPTNQPVTITVTGADTLSGVKEIQTPDGRKIKGSIATYSAPQSGAYTFVIIDQAGNTFNYAVNVTNIDNGAPSLTLTVSNPDTWARSKVIQASAQDTQGISWIKLPNGNLVYQDQATYTVTENNYYYFETSDMVGNKTRTYIYVGKMDQDVPNIELKNYTPNLWVNEDVEVIVNGGN